MTTSNKPTETPTKKSTYTKAVEQFEKLSLKDKIESYDIITELLRVDLEKEKANLSQQRIDIEELLEQIKGQ